MDKIKQCLIGLFSLLFLSACWDGGDIANTDVKGEVIDFYTEEPVPNASLRMLKIEPGAWGRPPVYSKGRTYQADAKGEFDINFWEAPKTDYQLVAEPDDRYFFSDHLINVLTEGRENEVQLVVKPYRQLDLSIFHQEGQVTEEYDKVVLSWQIDPYYTMNNNEAEGGWEHLYKVFWDEVKTQNFEWIVTDFPKDTVLNMKAVPGMLYEFDVTYFKDGDRVTWGGDYLEMENKDMKVEVFY